MCKFKVSFKAILGLLLLSGNNNLVSSRGNGVFYTPPANSIPVFNPPSAEWYGSWETALTRWDNPYAETPQPGTAKQQTRPATKPAVAPRPATARPQTRRGRTAATTRPTTQKGSVAATAAAGRSVPARATAVPRQAPPLTEASTASLSSATDRITFWQPIVEITPKEVLERYREFVYNPENSAYLDSIMPRLMDAEIDSENASFIAQIMRVFDGECTLDDLIAEIYRTSWKSRTSTPETSSLRSTPAGSVTSSESQRSRGRTPSSETTTSVVAPSLATRSPSSTRSGQDDWVLQDVTDEDLKGISSPWRGPWIMEDVTDVD